MAKEEIQLVDEVARAILLSREKFRGFNLPTPQESGTEYQKLSYAKSAAKTFIELNDIKPYKVHEVVFVRKIKVKAQDMQHAEEIFCDLTNEALFMRSEFVGLAREL